MANENTKLRLLTEKLNLLQSVADITKGVIFSGDDDDAGKYVGLYTKREGLFNKITTIDQKLADMASASGKDAAVVEKRIKDVISAIIQLDKKVEPFAQKAMEALRGGIKDVNVGKSLSSGYKLYLPDDAGVHFDTKN